MTNPISFSVSERALVRVLALTADKPVGTIFRVEVSGGGCAGFRYGFTLGLPAEDDVQVFPIGSPVGLDAASAELLGGAILDWEETPMRDGPVVRNPSAVSTCGCGVSFS